VSDRSDRLAGLQRSSDRKVPPDWTGDILLFDIDKTYLDTQFSNWRGLLRIPLEFALDKEAVPGAAPLIRALRRGPGPRSALVPLYFVSGSPLELRSVIERKMTLDGVEFDGITFKDQLGLAKQWRFSAIKAQVGYKLRALLLYALELPRGARWLCFGDDVESDAEVFALFGEVVAGLRGTALDERLQERSVETADRARVCSLADELGPARADPVLRIFIRRTREKEGPDLQRPQVVPTPTFLGAALVLRAMGRINDGAVAAVADDLRTRHVPEAVLAEEVQSAGERFGVPSEILALARR